MRTSRGMVSELRVTGYTAFPAPGDIGGIPPFTGVAIGASDAPKSRTTCCSTSGSARAAARSAASRAALVLLAGVSATNEAIFGTRRFDRRRLGRWLPRVARNAMRQRQFRRRENHQTRTQRDGCGCHASTKTSPRPQTERRDRTLRAAIEPTQCPGSSRRSRARPRRVWSPGAARSRPRPDRPAPREGSTSSSSTSTRLVLVLLLLLLVLLVAPWAPRAVDAGGLPRRRPRR